MHPAVSVILFTTLSGAGYGLLFLVGLLVGTGALPEGRWFAGIALGLSLTTVTVGLLSSTFHLGHPERAWRALSQWRSSWLSREGVLSLLVYFPAGLFALFWIVFADPQAWLGWLSALLAALTVYCTSMIYASLKPIPRWHHRLVPANYMLLALMSGALLLQMLLSLMAMASLGVALLAVAAILAASAAKLAYWHSIDHSKTVSSAESATGLGALGRVRLLEAPHSSENYLMKEMGHAIARRHAAKLRRLALVWAFLLPLMLSLFTLILPAGLAAAASVLAAISGLAGVLIERWLFFAEAKHAVTLYYGAPTV